MLAVSAMYMFPLSSTVRPFGWFILASRSFPSTCPEYPSADPATSFGLLSEKGGKKSTNGYWFCGSKEMGLKLNVCRLCSYPEDENGEEENGSKVTYRGIKMKRSCIDCY